MKVAILSREFPPDVYGGAGVHVEYLARELDRLVDLTVHCWGEERPEPGVVAHRAWDALDSMVCPGVVVSGGEVRRSVLSPAVHIHSHASVEDSVLFPGVEIGRGAVIRRAIIDKNVYVHPGAQVGVDLVADKERWTVSHDGVVVIGKGDVVEP